MQVYIRIKAAGRKRDVLTPTPYIIPDSISTLRQLLMEIVRIEVAKYNKKECGTQIIPFLTKEILEDQAKTGKVSFGTVYSDKKADLQKAQENALQCFRDGLVRILMNDEELTDLDAPIHIPENAQFTFIRLTFLTGVMW